MRAAFVDWYIRGVPIPSQGAAIILTVSWNSAVPLTLVDPNIFVCKPESAVGLSVIVIVWCRRCV